MAEAGVDFEDGGLVGVRRSWPTHIDWRKELRRTKEGAMDA